MALVVNTNIASLTAQNYATSSRKEMETAMERLSSGVRINSAKDDAAGLAISTRLDSQIRGLAKGVQNANAAISMAQTAEGAQREITEMLQRMRELAVQAANSSNNAVDRDALDAEVQQLIQEIDQIANETEYNGQKLLAGGFQATIQMGPNASNSLSFDIASMKSTALGLGAGTAASGSSIISGRVALAAVDAGDIIINGQGFGAITANMDLRDVSELINDSVDNVIASGFNEVTAKHVGTGVTGGTAASDGIIVTVVSVNDDTTTAGATQTANIVNTTSLQEVVDEINSQLGSYVTALINDDGKLELRNDTGATITVDDNSTNSAATGIGGTAKAVQTFTGFLKLESTDGSDVRVEKAFVSSNIGTDTDLARLGFRENGVDNSPEKANQIQGAELNAAGAAEALEAGDLKINGVDVFDASITTTSIDGKLAAINAKSAETGVTASAYFEKVFNATSAVGTSGVADLISVNGVALGALDNGSGGATDGSVSTAEIVYAFNQKTSLTGITAEQAGDHVKLSGNLTAVTFSSGATNAAIGTVFGVTGTNATAQDFAGIRLDSLNDGAISIDLGERVLGQLASSGTDPLGFLEANVGAGDYDTNEASSSLGGSGLTGVTVSSQIAAQSAIDAIDLALQGVSDSASSLGAIQNRLGHAIANMQETIVNTEASKSRIVDADFAVESARLAKQQVLQQASTAMLAQANASAQSVLTLLGG